MNKHSNKCTISISQCIFLCIICIVFLSQRIYAAEVQTFNDTYGILEQKVDEYVEENQDSTAAMSYAVFENSVTKVQKSYGYVSKEDMLVADDETVYEWGSVTKLLTWISVMQLVEAGKIDLSQDIEAYLPDGFLTKRKFESPITMINLMNHNAGWQEVYVGLFVDNESQVENLEKALRNSEPEQIFEPGTVCAYSNWSTALAGYIVERVSGESFDKYVQNHIFKPLGMEHTAMEPTLKDNLWVMEKRQQLMCYDAKGNSLEKCLYYNPLYPAGSAVGTVGDFAKFAMALIPGDGKKMVLFKEQKTLDAFLSPTLTYEDGNIAINCHGLWTMKGENELLWHNGGTIGCSTMLCIDPVAKKGLVVMTNQSDESIYTDGLVSIVFGNNENRLVQSKKDTKTDDKRLNGYYIYGRTAFRGCLKTELLFATVKLKVNKDGTLTLGEMKAIPIRDNLYDIDVSGHAVYLFTDVRSDKNILLRMAGGDFIKISAGVVFGRYLLCLVTLLAILGSIIGILSGLIIRRRKQMKPANRLLYRINMVTSTSILLFVVNMLIFELRVSLLELMPALRVHLVLNIVLVLIPFIHLVIYFIRWYKWEITRRTRAWITIYMLLAISPGVFVFYWELYRFW